MVFLALKRFDSLLSEQRLPVDKTDNEHHAGRLHVHNASGLLDTDFHTPSLDYIDLNKSSRQLCKSPAAGYGKVPFPKSSLSSQNSLP